MVITRAARTEDAKNRSLRTFLTGLGIDLLVALALALTALFATNDGWGTIEWALVSYSFAKSLVQAGAAFVLRQFLDPSRLPTPLPPGE